MRDMLYINGQLVDLADGVDITLNYKSNLLTELDKIVGNNSYTIKLPKTSRNMEIIGCADMPSAVTSFPRNAHSARYFRNGVEIIPDGRAVLLSVGEHIEVALAWGVSSAFFRLTEDGRNINEFPNIDDYVQWEASNSKSVYDGVSKVINADVRYGLVSGEKLAAIHPSVRSSYIFDLLGNQYGIRFDFPDDRKAFINSLIIPLVTRKGGFANSSRSKGSVAYSSLTLDYVFQDLGGEATRFFTYVPPYDWSENDFIGFRVNSEGKVTIQPMFRSYVADIAVYYGSGNIPSEWTPEYLPYHIVGDGSGRDVYVYEYKVEIDLAEGDNFGINLTDAIASGFNGTILQVEIVPNIIKIGDKFPIVENLPGITGVDFLKAIASIAGMFCVPSTDGDVIKFIAFDSLVGNGNALDWSGRVVPADYSNRPRVIGYVLDGFARVNRMLWADDDSVKTTAANGYIIVEDYTLDYERDAVVLPFSATDTRDGMAMIRLYEYPDAEGSDQGEPELQSVEPRLLIEKNVNGYSTGTFNGLHWNSLIEKYYKTYQDAVRTPVVITENIMLDEIALRDLDMSVPVYLRQYGKYYAVVEVKAPSSGVCECKLLQLND